jgi:hypothetical protein
LSLAKGEVQQLSDFHWKMKVWDLYPIYNTLNILEIPQENKIIWSHTVDQQFEAM